MAGRSTTSAHRRSPSGPSTPGRHMGRMRSAAWQCATSRRVRGASGDGDRSRAVRGNRRIFSCQRAAVYSGRPGSSGTMRSRRSACRRRSARMRHAGEQVRCHGRVGWNGSPHPSHIAGKRVRTRSEGRAPVSWPPRLMHGAHVADTHCVKLVVRRAGGSRALHRPSGIVALWGNGGSRRSHATLNCGGARTRRRALRHAHRATSQRPGVGESSHSRWA